MRTQEELWEQLDALLGKMRSDGSDIEQLYAERETMKVGQASDSPLIPRLEPGPRLRVVVEFNDPPPDRSGE